MILFTATALGLAIAGLAAATLVVTAVIERRHPPAGRFVAVSGGRLHVAELGPAAMAAPPIVLLHGASGNLEDMRFALGERLAGRHHVILIDRPGHGWSDRPNGDGDASPGRQAALIAEALDRLGVERAIIVGHSWSGALATAFALDHPSRVAGLMLIAPVTHPWPGGVSWYYSLATTPVIGPLFVRTLVMPLGLFMVEAGSRGVFAPQPVPTGYVDEAAINLVLRPAEFVANARDVAGLKAFVAAQAPRYGEISAPTVIISGDRDATVSVEIHSRAIAAMVPQARLVVLPGVGHMPHHVASDTVIAEIDRLALMATAKAAR